MDTFLDTVKADILAYADEPENTAKFSTSWIYRQIGLSAMKHHQHAVSQHQLMFKATADYTVGSDDVTAERTRWPLPGNFYKYIACYGLDSTRENVASLVTPAPDANYAGITIVNAQEFELCPTPSEGTAFTLYYQRKAVSDIFYATAESTSTVSKLITKFTNATGIISYTDS